MVLQASHSGATEMPRLQQEEDAAADANGTYLRDALLLRESNHLSEESYRASKYLQGPGSRRLRR